MYFPKSNPDLNNLPPRRQSRRQSRGIRNSRQMRNWQFKISNPLRQVQQQNMLPTQIPFHIQQMEYISTNSIKNIELPQTRRTSNFVKNLQMMQQLARMQQQKYSGMLKEGTKVLNKKATSNQRELLPINITEDDRISLQLNGFYDYKQRIDDDFDMFDNGDVYAEQPAMFYSNQEIQPDFGMDEEFNNYLK